MYPLPPLFQISKYAAVCHFEFFICMLRLLLLYSGIAIDLFWDV